MTTRQRIVIIDDNANDREVTRRFLDRRGYDVVPAGTGEEGLLLAAQSHPDAIIVDYRMPGMDGFEVTRRLKADKVVHRDSSEKNAPYAVFEKSDQDLFAEALGELRGFDSKRRRAPRRPSDCGGIPWDRSPRSF